MTIQSYLSSLTKDYHRPNLFSVFFDPIFISLYKIDYSSILVRSTQIPGQTINTVSTLYNNKIQHFAERIDLDPITMEFYCDTSNQAHSFLLEWQNKTISPLTRIKNYKMDYVGKIDIGIHDRPFTIFGIESVKAQLINAFPINVSPIELSHDSEGEICKFSATFQYDDVVYTLQNGLSSNLLSFGVGVAGFL